MSVCLSDLYDSLRQSLCAAGISTADKDARIIIQHYTGYEWADIIARPDQIIAKGALKAIINDAQRRINGEPVSRIYGTREFWGLEFRICEDTLDPRPDTETLIEAALKHFKQKSPENILDLGTGSGCILIALLTEFQDARGIGIDKSSAALKTAIYNAENNGVGGRAQFYCGSWGQALDKKFDLIVSNPPYIPNQDIPNLSKEVQNHDPILALDGGKDGLNAYREIFKHINSHLKPNGIALFEIGYNQRSDVMRLAEKSGLSLRDVHHDLAGLARVVEISCGDK